MPGWRAALLAGLALCLVSSCGQVPEPGAGTSASTPSEAATSVMPPVTTAPSTAASTAPAATPAVRPTPSARPTESCPATVPQRLSLRGEQGRAFAFAPVRDPGDVTVEGEVVGSQAWSTSKVLVAAAFIATTADGDPEDLPSADRRLVAAALTRSDGDAVRSLRSRIPGSPGRAMTAVLREIGDDTTTAPDSLEGTMSWSLREQVRFVAALSDGRVVSPAASDYLLDTMRPIEQHRWGLGTVGATTFKGGWLRQGRVTRQMGLLDGYAVAISTDRGPVVRQTDGDSAHVVGLNRVAEVLADRLELERRCR